MAYGKISKIQQALIAVAAIEYLCCAKDVMTAPTTTVDPLTPVTTEDPNPEDPSTPKTSEDTSTPMMTAEPPTCTDEWPTKMCETLKRKGR